jgi:hypothetical protein
MFRKTNEELDLAGLDDFIEKPSQECNEEELKKGVNKILVVLSKNPAAIMTIIANHPFIPGTFLLDDLAEKMNKQNSIEKLGMLFDKCLDDLVEACVYNSHDLERCVKAMPAYSDKVIQNILSNENRVKRILDGDKNPAETFKELGEKYPHYKDQFTEFYNRNFNTAPSYNG